MSEPGDSRIKLHDSWKAQLKDEFDKPYMPELRRFLLAEKQKGKRIYPPGDVIFNALNSTPFNQVKVVILGQDPYHGPGQAHGLCFSVKPGIAVPRSLVNIFTELHSDVGINVPAHGYLGSWAAQGVLLLNAVLTVEATKAASHEGRGWERFTDAVVSTVNSQKSHVVFLLWGSYAQKKGAIIDRDKHLVLKSPHPSPLSASRGFFGNRHFSKTNTYLQSTGQDPIEWSLPEPD